MTSSENPVPPWSFSGIESTSHTYWAPLLVIFILLAWYLTSVHGKLASGEPPMVPYKIPWLGHGLSFVDNVNKFTEWVRSKHPTSSATTVQVAGKHLYLIFDPKLASQVFRKSRIFIFDPFVLMTWSTFGATREDIGILEMGAQVTSRKKSYKDDGRRVLLELHSMSVPHLTGEPLERLTALFNDTLCECIDERFPTEQDSSYEWQTLDLCEYVKSTWTRASTISLFGTHVYTIWPSVEEWIWSFDKNVNSLFTRMPRIFIPRAYALRDEGLEMCQRWEADAEAAQKDGKIPKDPDWDPFWGQRPVRLRAAMFKRNGLSPRARAASHVAFLWGQTANAIPIAVQVLTHAILSPSLLTAIRAEITSCQIGPTTFDMHRLTTRPRLKSLLLESLRWATSSPSPRVVREDCTLGPWRLRAGSLLIVDARALQMDPCVWTAANAPEASLPQNFWPERFLDVEEGDEGVSEAQRVEERREAESMYAAEATRATVAGAGTATASVDSTSSQTTKLKTVEPISGPRSREIQQRMLALRPFGGGTTLCPGRHFATNEILGGLAALLLRLDIEVLPEALAKNGVPMPDLSKQGGLFPDRPLMVRLRRRRG